MAVSRNDSLNVRKEVQEYGRPCDLLLSSVLLASSVPLSQDERQS